VPDAVITVSVGENVFLIVMAVRRLYLSVWSEFFLLRTEDNLHNA